MSTAEKLVIVGAGPKAMAVCARATVLAKLGYRVPAIHIVEKKAIAANWTPTGGRTTGKQRLGSYPEKDVGYPYESTEFDDDSAEIDRLLFDFSWTSYKISRQEYGAWVDRGRPQPPHLDWAEYLRWVAHKSDFELTIGEVTHLEVCGERWSVTIDDGRDTIDGDHLMITGPGPASSRFPTDIVVDTHSFFSTGLPDVDRRGHVAVVGGGETAASIVEGLVSAWFSDVTVITPAPVIYSRGEGFMENLMFNNPDMWLSLPERERQDLIRRIDRGVFSTDALLRLSGEIGVKHRQGRVTHCHRKPGTSKIELGIVNGHRDRVLATYDAVVDGSTSLRDWFLDVLGRNAVTYLNHAVQQHDRHEPPTFEHLETHIDKWLSVEGARPRLFLPMLAGLRQGPGFPNLCCLGRLSERILRPLVD